MNRNEISDILHTLTLEEKASLCSGADFWQTKAISAKGVPSVWLSDGPHGLRKEDLEHLDENEGHSIKATCFPPEATLACSWDSTLIENVGSAIAEECLAAGVSVLLGPGVNIKRSPLCGRNFEYYSEDPFLTGKLATAMINGIQQQGVGACIKHFAANSQEHKRMSISSEVDERALNEIYLRAFRMAITHASPATVMCSYNKINNVYSSENKELLTNILREKWGFNGLVMSDWGAVHSRPAGIKAGLDLEMPSSGGVNDGEIVKAVQEGTLSLAELDKAVYRILCLVFDGCAHKNAAYTYDKAQHHMLAIKALNRSAVLLKNDGALPLCHTEDIAVIGAMACHPRIQGSGSSMINAFKVDSFVEAVGNSCPYAKGYHTHLEAVDGALINSALALAQKHKTVVYFMGLTEVYECEGYDRSNMSLPRNQVDLLEKLYNVNDNIIVVLTSGCPVVMPWLGRARALLYVALGGEGMGEAVRRLIYGEVCPSGKLADTWPLSPENVPCAKHYPMGPGFVSYNESIYVGYRYYDKAAKDVLFPFGFGLSYAHFCYDALILSHSILPKGAELLVTCTITNDSEYDGCEISQVYISHKNSKAYQPVKVLAGFTRTRILMRTTEAVCISVPYSAFAFYDVSRHDFVVEGGEYEILCGSDSRHLPIKSTITVEGEQVSLPTAHSASGLYGNISDNVFSDKAFASIHKITLTNRPKVKGEYTDDTTLGEMQASFTARLITKLSLHLAHKALHYSTDSDANKRVCEEGVSDLPFKNLIINAQGLVSYETSACLLDMCNGKRKVCALIKSLLHKNPNKRR